MRGTDTGHLLIRGRHIGRYRLDERASVDSATRWLDEGSYVAARGNPEGRPSLEPRIAKQAITDLNDPRRIIGALCPPGRYLLDSCDYLAPDAPYDTAYVLGILNSDVADWRFRMTSSNNNVNAYEIDEIPFPAVPDWAAESRQSDDQRLTGVVEAILSGVLVDVLAALHGELLIDSQQASPGQPLTTSWPAWCESSLRADAKRWRRWRTLLYGLLDVSPVGVVCDFVRLRRLGVSFGASARDRTPQPRSRTQRQLRSNSPDGSSRRC